MAGLPSMTQLGGNLGSLLEGYLSLLDPNNSGRIDAASAAAFLKKSQLREPILHKIWSLSDPAGKGYLDKQGLFMALRLIAVCQAGKEPSVSNMTLHDPPPKISGVELPSTNKWTVEATDRTKYEQIFQSLQPYKGLLVGGKARPFMLTTKLPLDVLGKVWNLSDIDKDGNLDLEEFCVAMKLMSLVQAGEVLPATLPPSLVPLTQTTTKTTTSVSSSGPSIGSTTISPMAGGLMSPTFGGGSPNLSSSPAHGSPLAPRKLQPSPSSSLSSLTSLTSTVASASGGTGGSDDVEWVVSAELKAKYDGYFQGIDKDHDGYISGEEARSLFMASNLPQQILAHIWNLSDMQKTGRLNTEQFALAMFLIAEKVRKKDPPKVLTAAMIPPSLRGMITSPAPPPSSSSAAISTAASDVMSSVMWGQTAPLAVTSGTVVPPLSSAWTTPTNAVATGNGGGGGVVMGFGNDFSAIQDLDSITNDIQSIRKERVELTDNIKSKQELLQQRKVELESLHVGVDSATEQREKLERDREEARALVDQLNTEKAKYQSQMAELKQNCDDEKEEIKRLKLQLSEQETSKRSQDEELEQLKKQLRQLKMEEEEYKCKVELSKAELDKLQKATHNMQTEITQVRYKIESLKEEHQSLTTALTLYPPTNTTPDPTPSSSVININDVGRLSAELHVPHLSEHDAVSARATIGSSSPVSSLSGFSTNSHLDEGVEECLAKEVKPCPDPFGTATLGSDPFAAFSLPSTVASDPFGGNAFSGKPSDLSSFDPFGGSSSDPFKTSGTGEDLFKSDPFGSVSSSSPKPSSSSTSSVPLVSSTALASLTSPHVVDPFSGPDPFHSDPFSSTEKNMNQESPWSAASGFNVDPFGQPSVKTPTDLFAGGDPFGSDPFGTKLGSTNGSNNPFGVSGDDMFGGSQKES